MNISCQLFFSSLCAFETIFFVSIDDAVVEILINARSFVTQKYNDFNCMSFI